MIKTSFKFSNSLLRTNLHKPKRLKSSKNNPTPNTKTKSLKIIKRLVATTLLIREIKTYAQDKKERNKIKDTLSDHRNKPPINYIYLGSHGSRTPTKNNPITSIKKDKRLCYIPAPPQGDESYSISYTTPRLIRELPKTIWNLSCASVGLSENMYSGSVFPIFIKKEALTSLKQTKTKCEVFDTLSPTGKEHSIQDTYELPTGQQLIGVSGSHIPYIPGYSLSDTNLKLGTPIPVKSPGSITQTLIDCFKQLTPEEGVGEISNSWGLRKWYTLNALKTPPKQP
jgi:hypothetical protein